MQWSWKRHNGSVSDFKECESPLIETDGGRLEDSGQILAQAALRLAVALNHAAVCECEMEVRMVLGDRVEINGERGTVIKIRFDSRLEPIYTVDLDNKEATPDGIYYARRQELKWIGWEPTHETFNDEINGERGEY